MKLNILYLHSHDTGRCIQPYGSSIETPNLQKLAREGVLFSRAFCAGPTCSPSRSALLTGQYPHQNGMMGLAHRGWKLNDYNRHLARFLGGSGYDTVLCGAHHETNHLPDLGYARVPDFKWFPAPAGGKTQNELMTESVTANAEKYLSEKHDKPFFMSVGFFDTHRVFDPPLPGEKNKYTPPSPLPDTPGTREDFAAFARSAKRLDAAYGRVLEALDKNGFRDNTLVICTTDHGIAFPYMKSTLLDGGTGVLLIMRGPGALGGGRTVDALVSHVDIYPTLCELLGLEKPEWLEGKSIMPLLEGKTPEIRDAVYGEVTYHAAYEPMRAVRTAGWKYIKRFGGRTKKVLCNTDASLSKTFLLEHGWGEEPVAPEELYDLAADPLERKNLAGDSSYAAKKKELSEKLDKWMRETEDPLLKGPVPLCPAGVTNDPDCIDPT